MKTLIRIRFLARVVAFSVCGGALAASLEELPLLEPDISAYQVSSHNKKGLNGDGGWYLHEGETEREGLANWSQFETGIRCAVLFDAVGPGSVRAIWGLGEHDLRIEADGATIVDAPQDDFFQGRVPGFPLPLVRKALVASGPWQCVSHWSFVPIGFRERCRITTRHPSPFYHVIAERFRDPSRVIPWSASQDLSLLKSAWAQPGEDPKKWAALQEEHGTISLAPGASVGLAVASEPVGPCEASGTRLRVD